MAADTSLPQPGSYYIVKFHDSNPGYIISCIGRNDLFSGLVFWLQMVFLPDPNLAYRAAYYLGVAKFAAIGVMLHFAKLTLSWPTYTALVIVVSFFH